MITLQYILVTHTYHQLEVHSQKPLPFDVILSNHAEFSGPDVLVGNNDDRDREDINSMCLTVVAQLLEKYDIPKDRIGRIEV